MKNLNISILALAIIELTFCSYTFAKTVPNNIILVIADGMGPSYTTAYRYLTDNPKTKHVEQTIFDKIIVGSASTYPAPLSTNNNKEHHFFVTDSAASATALATGIKTYNGAIGINPQKDSLLTVLEWAKIAGKKTGIAVTSQINHATPASFIAKNVERTNYNAIADDYFDLRIDSQFKVDVMFGGGKEYFIRKDRNLKDEFIQSGYQYIDSLKDLDSLNSTKPALGLFANTGLTKAIDSDDKYRLSTMTKHATRLLENDKGFFLLVEASQIDWGGHANDIVYAMNEMKDLAETMKFLESYVNENPNTLVILTSDHNTGGFSIGANEIYKWQPEFINSVNQSPDTIAKRLAKKELIIANISSKLGFPLTNSESKSFESIEAEINGKLTMKELSNKYAKLIKEIVNQRSHTGWTTKKHTGVDVPVHAFGLGKENFNGFQDNTDIAKKIFMLMGKTTN